MKPTRRRPAEGALSSTFPLLGSKPPPCADEQPDVSAPSAAMTATQDPRWSPEGVWCGLELPEGTHGHVRDPARLYSENP